jgi:hypothetical protein
MKGRTVQAAIGRVILITVILIATVSCATMTNVETEVESKPADKEAVGKVTAFVEKSIRIYDKYDALIPAVIHDLKQCAPVRKQMPAEVSHSAQWVIDYGTDLQSRGYRDIDKATVQNELYWKAIVALSANDITALLTRLLLLMREGELRRATIVLLFCAYDQNQSWDRDGQIIQLVANDINQIEAESSGLIEQGIRQWDLGNRRKALELYYKALQVFPKSPWALWEIAYDHLTYDLDPEELLDGRFETRYQLIRDLDPHYELAYYQGKNTPQKRAAVAALTQKVRPAYAGLYKGEDVLTNMKSLADGYFEMREYEFALYAYKYVLFRTYKEGFDQAIVGQIAACLQAMGMERVAPYLDQYLLDLDSMITAERNRQQATEEHMAEVTAYEL